MAESDEELEETETVDENAEVTLHSDIIDNEPFASNCGFSLEETWDPYKLLAGGNITIYRPIAFPSGSITGSVPVIKGDDFGPFQLPLKIPMSFRRLFGLYRMSNFVENFFEAFTPKLQRSLYRIYGFLDSQQSRVQVPLESCDAHDSGPTSQLPESARCGFQTVTFRGSFQTISGVHPNNFWRDLAGLHKEEYVSRTFADDFKSPTSEFRQLCKFLQASESALRGRGVDSAQEQVFYSRFTKNWGSTVGLGGEGVMTRMRFTFSYEGDMTQVKQAIVVISPEEYEAAVRLHPQLCEHLASQVMGRKPVQELLSPQLIEDESVLNMSRTAEGRAKFDHLADILDGMFSFLPIS